MAPFSPTTGTDVTFVKIKWGFVLEWDLKMRAGTTEFFSWLYPLPLLQSVFNMSVLRLACMPQGPLPQTQWSVSIHVCWTRWSPEVPPNLTILWFCDPAQVFLSIFCKHKMGITAKQELGRGCVRFTCWHGGRSGSCSSGTALISWAIESGLSGCLRQGQWL